MTTPRDTGGEAVAHLAVQLAALRGLVRRLNARLDEAGITEDARFGDRFDELARMVTEALSQPPLGPPAPVWTGLDGPDREARLAELREWVDTVLRTQYDGCQLADCWTNHWQAVWELSTLAAQWQRIYTPTRPSLDEALKFYDRWLPGTIRRVGDITLRCRPECAVARRILPGGGGTRR